MPPAPLPANEAQRLTNLLQYQILDTPAEKAFDSITEFAVKYFDLPVALVTLIDHERQWFKASTWPEISETDRKIAFCGYTILANETMIVADVLSDPRFADNPAVMGEPFIRFYAGTPIHTAEGYNIGTFCLLDTKPRTFSDEQKAQLERLSRLVVSRLELRLATHKLKELNGTIRASFEKTPNPSSSL